MTDDDVIADMLLTWEEAHDRGHVITAEELCRDRPDLLAVLRERIRLLADAAWMRRSPASPADKPRTLAERYSLEKLIGSGGYAQVWRAYDLRLHRHVAVKIPKPSRTLTDAQVEEILIEARQIARLRHVNIVTVHDVVKEGAGYFLVTDLIDGETLADRLKRGPLSPAEAVKLLARVARVIDYAHGQGVVHRDMKPANIFLDRAGQPHVGDFGLARSRDELVVGSDGRGTLAYSSPEQLDGKPLDGRADIWSLGVILFEVLTGRPPFADDDPVRLREAITSGAVPDMAGVPDRLAAVCRRSLAPDPVDRFGRGTELAGALEAALNPRRSRGWLLAVGVLALSVGGVLVWAAWPKPEPDRGGTAPTTPQPDAPGPGSSGVTTPLAPVTTPAPITPPGDAIRVLRGHTGAVNAVALTADGDLVASGGADGQVRLWPVGAGDVITLPHDGPVSAVRLGRRGHTVLTGTASGTVTLWGLPPRTDRERITAELRWAALDTPGDWSRLGRGMPVPGQPWKVRTFQTQVGGVKAVAISADGQFVAWAGAEKLEVWEAGGSQPLTVARTPGETIHQFTFLDSGFLLAAFGFGAERKVTTRTWVMQKLNDRWVASPRPAGANLELFSDVRGFTTAADGSAVLVTQTNAVRVFLKDAKGAGLNLAGSYESPKVGLTSSVILPAGRAITAGQDHSLRFWTIQNQSELGTVRGHTGAITTVDANADGRVVVTASGDGTVRIWKNP